MAKRTIVQGSTNVTIDVFIQNSSVTTGAGLTGLVFNSSGLSCYYREGATASATALTLATQTVGGAHTDGGFVEIDATNMPGHYRLDLSDTIVSGTNPYVTIQLKGATNMAPCNIELELVVIDPFAAVVPANMTQISGDATAADNAESFFDGTGYAGTNNIIPSVTTVTGNVGGIAGTITTLDALDTAQDTQHAQTQSDIAGLNDPTAAAIRAEIDSNSTQLALILSKMLKYVQLLARSDAAIETDNATELTAINADGGSGAGNYSAQTDSVEALRDRGDAAWITATGFSTHSASDVTADMDANSTQLAAIVADTNELQTDDYPTTLATLATAAALATVDGIVDDLKLGVILGSAQTGTLSTTQATTDLTGYADDQLIGRVIIWTSGNCDGEATDITDYANASGLITFTALTTAPANGDTFKIV